LSTIETVLDTAKKTVSTFALGVSVTNGWDIAPKVSLEPGLQVSLTLVTPADRQVVRPSASVVLGLAGRSDFLATLRPA
jgi:hypothetical protein